MIVNCKICGVSFATIDTEPDDICTDCDDKLIDEKIKNDKKTSKNVTR